MRNFIGWQRLLGNMGAATVVVIADYLLVLTDCVIAGRVMGVDQLGAMNLMLPVFSMAMFFIWLVSSGSISVYAKALSRGRPDYSARMAGTGIAVAFAAGLIAVVVLAVLRTPYFNFMGTSEHLTSLAGSYWNWYQPVVLLAAVELMMFYLVFANGGWTVCIISYAVQTIVNMAASYVLCLRYGMAGLSFGSIVAYLAGIIVLLPRFLGGEGRIAVRARFDMKPIVSSLGTSFWDAFVWLFHAAVFIAIDKYVLAGWDEESLAVNAVVFCIIRMTAFFGGIGFVLRTVRMDKDFLKVASSLSFMIMALATAMFFIAPELLAALFGIEDIELVEGVNLAARITVGALVASTVLIFLPMVVRAKRSSQPKASLNYLQQYVLKRMGEEPDSQMFNLVKLFRLRRGIDLERLSNALVASAKTHAALRTVLRHDVDGEVVQRLELDKSAIECPVVRAKASEVLSDKAALVTEFGAFGKRLFNACIYDCGGGEAYLLSDFHHLVCDGYSFPLILEGARKVYNGETLEDDAYYEVLSKREAKAKSKVAVATCELWRELLKERNFITLPPEDFAGEGGFGCYETPIVLPEGFETFLANRRVTRHHVFLAATVIALAKISAAEAILIDWVFHGRVSKDELKTVGAFMVDLPLTVENLADLTPSDVLSRVKASTFNGIRSVAAIRSVSDVNPDDRERLTFNCHDEWGELMSSGAVREDGPFGWIIEETIPIVPPAARPENPFNVEIMEHREGSRLFIEYDTGRYSERTVVRYAEFFKEAITSIVEVWPR